MLFCINPKAVLFYGGDMKYNVMYFEKSKDRWEWLMTFPTLEQAEQERDSLLSDNIQAKIETN